jgi:hypothetical protein
MTATSHFEAPNGAAPRSINAGIFQPPESPSVTGSSYFGVSTGSWYTDATSPGSHTKRKRTVPVRDSTPSNDWATASDLHSKVDDDPRYRNENTRTKGESQRDYVLAGQIETPNGHVARQLGDPMEESTYSDVDYRRALGSKRPRDEMDSPVSFKTADSRLQTGSQMQSPGWGKFAFGVMGKVWDFCKGGGPFRGFYAGGGDGYSLQQGGSLSTPQRPAQPPNEKAWCNEHDVPTLPTYNYSAIPGGFPESDYTPFFHEHETPESTPQPAAKRRQVGEAAINDELRKNWVMVDESPDPKRAPRLSQASLAPSPARPSVNRRISKPVSRLSAPGLSRRASSRASRASAAPLSVREPASFASPRSPVPDYRPGTPSRIPLSTRPQSPGTHSPSRLSQHSQIPAPSSYSQSNGHGHRRNHSTASVGSAASSATGRMRKSNSNAHELVQDNSPRLDAEAKRMAAKRLQQEHQADLKMNDINAQIKAMIREGKEALGSTVEVEGGGGEDENDHDFWEDD